MKIALFLDVDKTLTDDFIQHVYAMELGVDQERYARIEKDFQDGKISSTVFGGRISELFASKNLSKSRAEELFGKVKLRSYVDGLFKLQEKGVDIYLVSSGPNYYIDFLAARKNIPADRVKCSQYIFDYNGVISGCSAVDANQKTQFVLDWREKYDVTIGIGDSARHDAFVNVCTIAMLTSTEDEPNADYIHVAHFNSVHQLIDNLLKKKTASEQPAPVLPSAQPVLARHIEVARGLLTVTVVAGTVLGLGFVGGGGWLVYLGGTGSSTFSLLGNSFSSANVGVASIFCGAVVAVLTLRRVMSTLGKLGGFS